MTKVKILFGLEAGGGGALKHLCYLVTGLDYGRFEVTVILSPRTPEAYGSIAEMERAGATVMIMKMSRSVNVFRDLQMIARIYQYLKETQFNLVHAHSSKAGLYFRVAAWLHGIPAIYTPHCFYYLSKTGISQVIYRSVEHFLGRLTRYIIVSSSEYNAALEGKIVPAAKLLNINNAIKPSDYHAEDKAGAQKRLQIPESAVVVGAIGRLVEQKDWLTYIYAAAKLVTSYKNVVFLIVGGGELESRLKKTVRDLRLEDYIIFTGHYPAIDQIYAVIDIFVNTSLWEGLPYVLLEAMWYQRPIVTTDMSYKGLITDQENGYLVPVRDPHVLAERILTLIQSAECGKRMGASSRDIILKNYSFGAFIQKHEALYLKMAGNTKHSKVTNPIKPNRS
jgi:glycosyltransferase involved in cell wall biosynthesis